MPILYRVKDWDQFENYRSREREELMWFSMPNKQHGLTFLRILTQPDGNGLAFYGLWVCILAAISQQRKPRAGWLTRDGTKNGIPWTCLDISLRFRCTVDFAQACLDFLSSDEIGWLEQHETAAHQPDTRRTPAAHPAHTSHPPVRHQPDTGLPPCCHPSATNMTGDHRVVPAHEPPMDRSTGNELQGVQEGNGEEGVQREVLEPAAQSAPETPLIDVPKDGVRYSRKRTRELAKFVLEHLNIKAGRAFRDTVENLDLIAGRLEEVHLDTGGVTDMVNRQVALWKGDPKMETFLRPSTLFRKSNFATYYDDRNQPAVRTAANQSEPDHEKGF
jgi:uncharacterized phage protein (TIGR02220 family)